MDQIDAKIAAILRNDARISYKEIAERIHLSANAVAERMRRMETAGVILGYHARLDPHALDLSLQAVIDVKMLPGVTAQAFEATLQTIPGVVEAVLMTGSFDYMVRVACANQEALVRLTENLRARGGVQDTNTRIMLRSLQIAAPLI
ncbi:Lrp/AsnC family transcriptional regulator [Pseudoduganella violacea]|uniref:Lrp/AsnC family leucine-responsive transcriptional regulator n=1 Tax=Pseudoduganella violacea TaxID=1715466 RepID=A0A7W5BCL5_9BURK|nr:Lrp/AsnC family transcriptional regulator [Pseudoduganella violacea]MBB3120646.1 Lrp/AsnC family leucine-responsive transcriptional regulator [Pseudoduganella violacea]